METLQRPECTEYAGGLRRPSLSVSGMLPPIPIEFTNGALSPSSVATSAISDSRPTDSDMNRNGAEVTLKAAIAVSAEKTKAIRAT